MTPAETAALIGAQLVLIALPAITLAWVLRRAGLPGGRTAAAILAGILVSLLAGPAVLAKARPELHSRIVQGGHDPRERLIELEIRQSHERAYLRESGVSPEAIVEASVRHGEQLVPLREAMHAARAEHRDHLYWLALSIAALHILLVMPTAIPRTQAAFRRGILALVSGKLLGVRLGGVIALLSVAGPAVVGLAMGYPLGSSIAMGVIFGVGGLSAALTGLPYAAGMVALLCSLAILVPAAYSPQLYLLGGALLISMLLATGLPPALIRRWRSSCLRFASAATLPAIVAIALVRFDYYPLAQTASFWIVLVLSALWSSDGRWFATAVAARIASPIGSPHRENPWHLATLLLDAGAATSQIFVALMLTASGAVPEYVLPAAVAGAALIELTRGARSWITSVIEFQKKLEDEAASRGL